MPSNPYSVDDWLIYRPTRRGHDLDVMTDTEERLNPGEKYKVAAIEKGDYVVVEGHKHPGGGIYWTEFGPDENVDRLTGNDGKFFAEQHLTQLKVDPDKWTVLWKDPQTGQFWKEYFPQSELHGGGAPEFVKITEQEAKAEFGSW